MANKELKKEYDKSRNVLHLRLSSKEWAILEKMMSEQQWENTAGFIKYKVFGDDRELESRYSRLKRSTEKEDIQTILKNLMTSLVGEIGYLNYRFNYELERLDKSLDKIDDAAAKKILATMTQWKKNVMERTEQVCFDCQDILKYIDIKIDKIKKENIQFAPESIIEKARKDWNDTMSPEALEGARRDFVEFHKRMNGNENT